MGSEGLMTTPRVTELPRRMEPATADPFLGEPGPAVPVIRELDHRSNCGIDVHLLWDQANDRVMVTVSDAKTGEAFEIPVAHHEARGAFHHPYARAAFHGIDCGRDTRLGESD
jgi:hypothetical protein